MRYYLKKLRVTNLLFIFWYQLNAAVNLWILFFKKSFQRQKIISLSFKLNIKYEKDIYRHYNRCCFGILQAT